MYDIGNLNIWKPETKKIDHYSNFLNIDITELNLSPRSFNCLKRAGCDTIQDVLRCIGEDKQGLRKIRNLGARSEAEILQRIEEYRDLCSVQGTLKPQKKLAIVKPAKKVWDRRVDEFHLSEHASKSLKACGVYRVGDLYRTRDGREPGWYAVRELFEKIPNCN